MTQQQDKLDPREDWAPNGGMPLALKQKLFQLGWPSGPGPSASPLSQPPPGRDRWFAGTRPQGRVYQPTQEEILRLAALLAERTADPDPDPDDDEEVDEV